MHAATPGTLTVRLGDSAAIGTANLPNFSTVVFGMLSYKYIDQIKAGSPGTRVLGYKSATDMQTTAALRRRRRCHSGVTYQEALAHDAA